MTNGDTLAVTRPGDSLAMNSPQRLRSNAANAVVQLDCPWCAEPVRATDQELSDGLTCSACCVVVQLAHAPIVTVAAPVAA